MLRLVPRAIFRTPCRFVGSANYCFDSLSKKPRLERQEFHFHSYDHDCQRRRFSSGRRRRRKRENVDDSSSEDDDGRGQVKKMDRDWFVSVAKDSLIEVERALEPMVAVNDVFVIKKGSNELGESLQIILSPHIGTYQIQIDEVSQIMTLTSPQSGMYTYMYDAHTNEWIGVNDGHSFKGMITRDLIQQCHGIPNF